MADQDRPNQTANKSKAEGERFGEETRGNAGEHTRNTDPDEHPERQYDDEDSDNAGGITNRPLSDEIGNQQSLPERGTTKDQTKNPGSRVPEGDYQENDR